MSSNTNCNKINLKYDVLTSTKSVHPHGQHRHLSLPQALQQGSPNFRPEANVPKDSGEVWKAVPKMTDDHGEGVIKNSIAIRNR